MKVAICISGQLRSLGLIWQNLISHLIEPYSADVFIALQKSDCISILNKIPYKIAKIVDDLPIDEKNYAEGRPANFFYPSLQANLQQRNRIFEANTLKCEYEERGKFKYDWVIRTRSDSAYLDKLSGLEDLPKDRIYVPGFAGDDGIDDRFAFGPSELMDVYANYAKEFEIDVARGAFFNPEAGLYAHLNRNGVKLDSINLDFVTVRTDSVYANFQPYSSYSVPLDQEKPVQQYFENECYPYRLNDVVELAGSLSR